jgi:serine/threonine-protein kinase HipA
MESALIVAGAVDRVGTERLDFTYARSYLENETAISLYAPELPMQRGAQEPLDGLTVAACLKDSTPDSWGERVIGNRLGSERFRGAVRGGTARPEGAAYQGRVGRAVH